MDTPLKIFDSLILEDPEILGDLGEKVTGLKRVSND